MRKILLLLLPILLVTLFVGACGETITETISVTPPPAAAVPPAGVLDKAPDVFTVEGYLEAVCSACHGPNLEGDIGPSLIGIGDRFSVEEVAAIIADGRHGTSMPTWGDTLAEGEIGDIALLLCEGDI